MADVLSKSNLSSSVFDNGSASISRRRRNLSAVRFARCKSKSFEGLRSSPSSCLKSNGFLGKRLDFGDPCGKGVRANRLATPVQMTLAFPKAMKWWKKGLRPNMKEIESAQDLVDSLVNAGNKLVILDFFSPGCGGCKALHPKGIGWIKWLRPLPLCQEVKGSIPTRPEVHFLEAASLPMVEVCQFAEQNPDVLFLHVNYEEHKSMCYSLNVHVLPFFRFYRGANGRLCSFSCTNATIKKFKDALAKHSTERCSLGPAKGLEESEIQALAGNRDLSFTYPRKPVSVPSLYDIAEAVPVVPKFPLAQPSRAAQEPKDDKTLLVGGGR